MYIIKATATCYYSNLYLMMILSPEDTDEVKKILESLIATVRMLVYLLVSSLIRRAKS
jgi:hypothetical protein